MKSRCGGRAAEHLVARSRSDTTNPFSDAADIFEHLKTIFQDPNRVLNAKGKLRRLFMKASDKFYDFLSEFIYLAQESCLAESEWKEELYHKLHVSLQRLVIRESNDSSINFKEFTTICTQTANRLELINLNEQRFRNRAPNPVSGNTSKSAPNGEPARATARKPATTLRPQTVLTERAQLMKEGECFYCKEQGHLAAYCPIKARTSELKAMELKDKLEERPDELATNTESEKDQP